MNETRLNPNSPFFHEERYASLAGIANQPITICGAGALGGNLAETLARMGFLKLKVIDKDRVEGRNLSTQPYSRAEIGAPKAKALANSLYRIVQAKLEPVVVEFNSQNATSLLKGSAVVIDAFDNHAGRAAISKAALELALPCLHLGFSPNGLYGSGLWEPDYLLPRDIEGDPCDYPLTRPLALTIVALAARNIADFFRTKRSTDFELTWHDFKLSQYPKSAATSAESGNKSKSN